MKNLNVENMTSSQGNDVPNQFIVNDREHGKEYFQSYRSIIVVKDHNTGTVTLDSKYWDWSKTTSKYRNQFLGENKADTQRKIDNGTYQLANLNG